MSEPVLIELTSNGGSKIAVNVDGISFIAEPLPGENEAGIHLAGDGPGITPRRVMESYSSIKETLRIRGVNVFTVLSVEDTVPVSKRVIEALLPVLRQFCDARDKASDDPCKDCPLKTGSSCIVLDWRSSNIGFLEAGLPEEAHPHG